MFRFSLHFTICPKTNNMSTVIFIVLKILAAAVLLLFALLLLLMALLLMKTAVKYSLNIKNFDFSFKYELTICGKKIIHKKKKHKQKNKISEKPDKTNEKKKRKIGLSDIKSIKISALEVVDALLKICSKCVVFDSFNLKFICALDNPASNGMLYGGLQSIVNILYAYFLANCNVKKSDLNINYDFKSSDGLIIENCGKIYIRPLIVVFHALGVLIREKNLRRHIRNLKKFFIK